jgi:hypothetical protein
VRFCVPFQVGPCKFSSDLIFLSVFYSGVQKISLEVKCGQHWHICCPPYNEFQSKDGIRPFIPPPPPCQRGLLLEIFSFVLLFYSLLYYSTHLVLESNPSLLIFSVLRKDFIFSFIYKVFHLTMSLGINGSLLKTYVLDFSWLPQFLDAHK